MGCCASAHWQNPLNGLFLFLLTQVKNLLDMSVLAFIPAIFLGILGGVLGAFFVFLNIKINKLRLGFLSTIPKASLRKTAKLLEIVLVLVSILMTFGWIGQSCIYTGFNQCGGLDLKMLGWIDRNGAIWSGCLLLPKFKQEEGNGAEQEVPRRGE